MHLYIHMWSPNPEFYMYTHGLPNAYVDLFYRCRYTTVLEMGTARFAD